MGIGTLRRYHTTLDPRLVPEAKDAEDQRTKEHQAAVQAAENKLTKAREATIEFRRQFNLDTGAALVAGDDPELQKAAEKLASLEEAERAAQADVEAVNTAWEDQAARDALYADAPSRSASRAKWVEYAEAHQRPAAGLVDADGRELTRDQIADIFLGPKA